MVDRRDIGSWLEGPGSRMGASGYTGERLGLPETGRGSVARFGRRLVAVLIDWTLCQVIAYAVFGVDLPFTEATAQTSAADVFIPLAVFAAENLLLVGTLGSTVGHKVVGLQVQALNAGAIQPLQTVIRTLLLCLFLPAMFWDRDGRALHDRAAGTVLVRTRGEVRA